MRMALAALAVTLLLGAALAQDATYSDACGLSQFDSGTDSAEFIAAAFMLVSLMIAGAYMYSRLRNDPQSGMWAKDEAANLALSVLLFAGLIAFFNGACAIAGEYAGGNPFDSARYYLDSLLSANGMTVLRGLTYGSLTNQFDATEYWYVGITPFSGSGVAEFANNRAFSSHKEFVIDLYVPIVASLNAQKQILEALQWVGASVLLPFAFIMRLVPMTRDFGNTLIALFFALYIVVPTMYAMSGEAFGRMVERPSCVDCGVHNFYSFGIDGGNGEGGGASSGLAWQNSTFYRVGSTIPQAVFLPNVVLVVAITCTSAVSKALRAIAV